MTARSLPASSQPLGSPAVRTRAGSALAEWHLVTSRLAVKPLVVKPCNSSKTAACPCTTKIPGRPLYKIYYPFRPAALSPLLPQGSHEATAKQLLILHLLL
ncbi:hypothetical protein NDU88_008829 [Pleurodeles waltl]|uniref:Uncharacterized protein n=1 Tax=Pleurodeles waltl TaxID=8319 RepID=A0AAV7N662_PLEWA|nr:hypothetical protein NDU88_008829 [Pleurodeles waltl]